MDRESDLKSKGCGFESQVKQELSVGGGVNNQRSLHLQYHNWSETLEQGTKLPTAPRGAAALAAHCSRHVCVYTWMG